MSKTSTEPMNAETVKWSQLLLDAVNKPGQLLAAYSAFHNYVRRVI